MSEKAIGLDGLRGLMRRGGDGLVRKVGSRWEVSPDSNFRKKPYIIKHQAVMKMLEMGELETSDRVGEYGSCIEGFQVTRKFLLKGGEPQIIHRS